MQQAIQLNNVSKEFNDFKAVDGISFEVNEGDIYGFLGPNGSGKSTSLRMIMGLIKPTSGEIKLFGLSLADHRREIMQKVGCIIEKPDFYGYLNAKENLTLCARASGIKYTQGQYNDLFQLVGLAGREHDKVKTYSHGMKQRLGLAQTLIHDPSLIILDEPNTGLDPQGIIDLRNLILTLNKERGKTILLSSHILSEVQEICNAMIVINKGKTVVQGNVADLLSHETLHVTLEINNTSHSINTLHTSIYNQHIIKESDQVFQLMLSKNQIPTLISTLTQQGVEIMRIDYRNQLEEYFLKITNA
jgi:ABC-2 type transport system ATP-binding protein